MTKKESNVIAIKDSIVTVVPSMDALLSQGTALLSLELQKRLNLSRNDTDPMSNNDASALAKLISAATAISRETRQTAEQSREATSKMSDDELMKEAIRLGILEAS